MRLKISKFFSKTSNTIVLLLTKSLLISMSCVGLLSAMPVDTASLREIPLQKVGLAPPFVDATEYQHIDLSSQLPATIPGYDLPDAFMGFELDKLQVYTKSEQGKVVKLAFQVDEYDQEGFVYHPSFSKAPVQGEARHFDVHDELVFMFGSAGIERIENADVSLMTAAKPILQLAVQSYSGAVRYILLAERQVSGQEIVQQESLSRSEGNTEVTRSHGELSTQSAQLVELKEVALVPQDIASNNTAAEHEALEGGMVHANLARGVVDTARYRIEFSPKNLVKLNSFVLKSDDLNMPEEFEVFDRYAFRISSGLLIQGFRLSFETGRNIRIRPLGLVGGPIRQTLLYDLQLTFLTLPVYRSRGMVRFYENGINIPSRFADKQLKAIARFAKLMKKPEVQFRVSAKNISGANFRYQNDFGEQYHFLVDGKMTEAETIFNETLMFGQVVEIAQEGRWSAVLSNRIPVVPGGLFESYLGDLKVYNHYQDKVKTIAPKSKARQSASEPAPDDRYEEISELSVGISAQGMPRPLLSLFEAVAKVQWEEVDSIGEFVDRLLEPENREVLSHLDQLNGEIIMEFKNKDPAFDLEKYRQIVLADLKYFRFGGVAQDKFMDLIGRSLMSCSKLSDCDLKTVFTAMKQHAAEAEVDLAAVRHVFLDNTIWFGLGLLSEQEPVGLSSL